MKEKDYGGNETTKKKIYGPSFPLAQIQKNLGLINQNRPNGFYLLKKVEENEKNQKQEQSKVKTEQLYENKSYLENKSLNSASLFDNNINSNSNSLSNEKSDINLNNCINNIDLDKNIIVLNKLNLKEINNINKGEKKEKNNEIIVNKGEVLNIIINEKFNYNKEVSNLIKSRYEYLTDTFFDSLENIYNIKSNIDFRNELIDNFIKRKRNKNKEKKNDYSYDKNYYISTFGNNPLQSLKNVQNDLIEPPPPPKGSKISVKQYKINQKNLKEQNYLIQKYIKSFPVFNCPDSNIFNLNQNYNFNKISEEKNINFNISNNILNKNIKNNNSYNMEIKEDEDNNKNKNKDDSEEETINRHLKKKNNKFVKK
jgi:hypothetical protein